MKKKILITGASGFIGSFLVDEALNKGYQVYAGIRQTSSKKFLQHKALNFFEMDFSSPGLLLEKFNNFFEQNGNFDFVIHNAGITKAKQMQEFDTVNYDYTKNLADAIVASSLKPEKFILVSSLATYGPGCKKKMEPINVSDNYNPISEYGRSKLKAVKYVKAISDFPYLIIHSTGVYGPRDKDFYQFIRLVSMGFEPYLGTHKQIVSLIYVKDLAKAIIALLPTSSVNCSYLLSDGNTYDKEQIGSEAKRTMNRKTIKLKLPLALIQMAVKGNDKINRLLYKRLPFINSEKLNEISSANWLCNSTEIWSHIKDQPSYNLKDGLAETIQWYKENKWL